MPLPAPPESPVSSPSPDVERRGDALRPGRRLPAGAWAVLLPLAFVGLYLAFRKVLGRADMPGAQALRLFVFIPAMAALTTGSLPLLAGVFRSRTWGRRIVRLLAVLLMVALTLPLALCSLAFDVCFT